MGSTLTQGHSSLHVLSCVELIKSTLDVGADACATHALRDDYFDPTKNAEKR